MRILGAVWLLLGATFVAAGAGLWFDVGSWPGVAAAAAVASAALCVLQWDQAKAGFVINVVIVASLLVWVIA